MNITFEKQLLDGVCTLHSNVNQDNRGYLIETYRKDVFDFLKFEIKQINCSFSSFRTLRGLHFQKGKYSQAKFITVQKGTILDVIVDLRNNSETFGKHQKFILSENTGKFLYVPKGFAHGFITLSDETCVTYLMDNYYNAASQSGIMWNDKTLNIDWEIEFEPILSEKDTKLPLFDKKKIYFD